MLTLESTGQSAIVSLGTVADLSVILTVIGLLILKEVSTSVPSTRARFTAHLLDIVLVPMLAIYVSLVVTRLLQGLT